MWLRGSIVWAQSILNRWIPPQNPKGGHSYGTEKSPFNVLHLVGSRSIYDTSRVRDHLVCTQQNLLYEWMHYPCITGHVCFTIVQTQLVRHVLLIGRSIQLLRTDRASFIKQTWGGEGVGCRGAGSPSLTHWVEVIHIHRDYGPDWLHNHCIICKDFLIG